MNRARVVEALIDRCGTELRPGMLAGTGIDLEDAVAAGVETEDDEVALEEEGPRSFLRGLGARLVTLTWQPNGPLDSSVDIVLVEHDERSLVVCLPDDFNAPGAVATFDSNLPDGVGMVLERLGEEALGPQIWALPELVEHHHVERLPKNVLQRAFRRWFHTAATNGSESFDPWDWADPDRDTGGNNGEERNLGDWTDDDWDAAADNAFEAAYREDQS